MTTGNVTLDERSHTYLVDGKPTPSVTQVLPSHWHFVDPDELRIAGERGRHVHLACELHCKGELDEASLDPELVPYLDGWKNFISDTGFVAQFTEKRIESIIHGFLVVGMCDVIGTMQPLAPGKIRAIERQRMRRHGYPLCLVEIKSGVLLPTAALQTAAYKRPT
jgi:hypothetical protein